MLVSHHCSIFIQKYNKRKKIVKKKLEGFRLDNNGSVIHPNVGIASLFNLQKYNILGFTQ